MRDSVRKFAEKMSQVMSEKNGVVAKPDTWMACMGQVQMQMRKFEETPFPSPEEARRIMLHVANWCCLAEEMLGEELERAVKK